MKYAILRTFRVENVKIPPSVYRYLAGTFIPGFAFGVAGSPGLARVLYIAYPIAAFVYIVAIGSLISTALFVSMLVVHGIGLYKMHRHLRPTIDEEERGLTWGLSTIFTIALYFVAQFVAGMIVTPVKFDRRVYVAIRPVSARNIQAGDTVAYHIDTIRYGNVMMLGSYGIGVVRGVPGDKIEFDAQEFRVNGVPFPSQTNMPQTGTATVVENQWFIWPDFAINGSGENARFLSNELMSRMGMVPQSQYRGKIFRRWFWRKQL